MENDYEDDLEDNLLEIDDESPQYLQDFNKIIKQMEQEGDNINEELKDLFREYYKNYNSLNPFIEYYEDIPQTYEIIHIIKELQKEF